MPKRPGILPQAALTPVAFHFKARLLPKQTALRLTPTKEAQTLGQLPAGEIARLELERGDYVYVRAGNDAAGWVERSQFGLISGK